MADQKTMRTLMEFCLDLGEVVWVSLDQRFKNIWGWKVRQRKKQKKKP